MKKMLAALAALLLAPAALADTLIDTVNGYTIGQGGQLVRFGSMVVDDAGKVSQIIPRGAKPNVRVQYRVDGRGRTLIPGLFDGEHSFALEPAAGGFVRFVHAETFRGLLVPLVARTLRTTTRHGFEAMNRALKTRVESARG